MVRFALPLDQRLIESWFNKQSHSDHLRNNIRTNVLASGISVELTCGNCQLICHPDESVRKRRYKMLVESGVIIQNPDGSLKAVTPREAQEWIAKMDADTRALYEEI